MAQAGIIDNINHDMKDIADELKIANRIEPIAETQTFISLKDHKEDFDNHPKCRLINPAKTDLDKVSKTILDKINIEIRQQKSANQWRNSDETIAWFKSLNNKNRLTFLSFDIVGFCPSISENLLDRAIEWGNNLPPFLTAISESLSTHENRFYSTTDEHGQTTPPHLT